MIVRKRRPSGTPLLSPFQWFPVALRTKFKRCGQLTPCVTAPAASPALLSQVTPPAPECCRRLPECTRMSPIPLSYSKSTHNVSFLVDVASVRLLFHLLSAPSSLALGQCVKHIPAIHPPPEPSPAMPDAAHVIAPSAWHITFFPSLGPPGTGCRGLPALDPCSPWPGSHLRELIGCLEDRGHMLASVSSTLQPAWLWNGAQPLSLHWARPLSSPGCFLAGGPGTQDAPVCGALPSSSTARSTCLGCHPALPSCVVGFPCQLVLLKKIYIFVHLRREGRER